MLVKLDNEYQEILFLEAWYCFTLSIYNWKLFEFITNWKLNNCQRGRPARNIEHDSPEITKKQIQLQIDSIIYYFPCSFIFCTMWILPHNKEHTAAFHNFPNLNFTQPGVEPHHVPSTRKLLKLKYLFMVHCKNLHFHM